METFEDFVEALSSTKKTCENCWHNRTGHCSMYSCECATDVARHHSSPRWWTSYEDGAENERQVLHLVKEVQHD